MLASDSASSQPGHIVPTPRFHITRCCGVLAFRHHLKSSLRPNSSPPTVAPGQLFIARRDAELTDITASPRVDRPPSLIHSASLLAHILAIDVTACPPLPATTVPCGLSAPSPTRSAAPSALAVSLVPEPILQTPLSH